MKENGKSKGGCPQCILKFAVVECCKNDRSVGLKHNKRDNMMYMTEVALL